MNRATTLLLLLLGIAAGVLLFRPTNAPEPGARAPLTSPAPAVTPAAPASDCDQAESCTTLPVPKKEPAPTPPSAPPQPPAARDPTPAPAPPQAAPPPVDLAEGARLREEADRLLAEGNLRDGADALRKATAADPSAKNHGDLGALLESLTVRDEALVHLRRAADLDPGNADRWIALANAYYRAVDPGKAWKAEQRAREAEPGLVLGRGPDGMRIRLGDSGTGKQ